jgi:[ribosomal protein S18]-alanine N-acetyltransferase
VSEAPAPQAGAWITPMVIGDLDEVDAIEQRSFPNPWPAQVFRDELEREWARVDVVREPTGGDASRVVAFCNYWIVRDEIHLLAIATHPELRRHGHADRLMQHLLDVARRHACRYITLEVRRSNAAAIAMYRAHGFLAVGLRPRYYQEDGEDALVMTLDLDASEPAI